MVAQEVAMRDTSPRHVRIRPLWSNLSSVSSTHLVNRSHLVNRGDSGTRRVEST